MIVERNVTNISCPTIIKSLVVNGLIVIYNSGVSLTVH